MSLDSALSPTVIVLIGGIIFLFIGVVGGGVQIEKIRLPVLPTVWRLASFLVGCVLIIAALILPKPETPKPLPNPLPATLATPLPPTPPNTQPATANRTTSRGIAIEKGIISVQEVKEILAHLGIYQGTINDKDDEAYYSAVTEFQASRNITKDGLVGFETLGELKKAWPERFGLKQRQDQEKPLGH